jgi:phosphoribosyl 1,2-cyclic phosphodiesterase
VKVTLWGTRGSLASPGPETMRYGGNTSCVEVRGEDGSLLVLDAGTGVRRLGEATPLGARCIHLLLTHLHMDHIQGLGFFGPLFRPDCEVHIWGPPSATLDLGSRLGRYLSPPLFPVRLRDLPCRLTLHNAVSIDRFQIGDLEVNAALVCHPGPTLGYRIRERGRVLTYIPDHEPALGAGRIPDDSDWVSGMGLAAGADLLIHDAQYTDEEYADRVGWGHSTVSHALDFAAAARVRRLLPFHHDPSHSDHQIDLLLKEARETHPPFEIVPGIEGTTIELA